MRESLRAVVYTRVSTGEQAENGTSLAGQVDACKAKAQTIGAQVVAVYEDAGVSGALYQSRIGIQSALCDLEQGKANCLIIANLSRYSRDREHQSTIKKRVEAAGARLVFCDMDFADTPEGDLAFGIMGSFADYERKAIKDRTTKGRKRRAQEGKQPCRAWAPMGYHIVSKTDVIAGVFPAGTEGTYQIVETEARVVREMFRRYASGDSLRDLVRWLQETGVEKKKGGKSWIPSTIQRMLANSVYKGIAVFGKRKRYVDEGRRARGYKRADYTKAVNEADWIRIDAPAIVTEFTWEACQLRLRDNKRLHGGNPQRRNLLTGILRCPRCHKSMICKHKRSRRNRKGEVVPSQYHAYYCPDHTLATRKQVNGCELAHATYNGKLMETLAMKAVSEAAKRPEMMQAAIQAYSKTRTSPLIDSESLQEKIEEVKKKEFATVKAQIAGIQVGVDTTVYEGILREITVQRVTLERMLDQIEVQRLHFAHHSLADESVILNEVMNAVHTALTAEECTTAEKHALLCKIVDDISPGHESIQVNLKSMSSQTVARITMLSP